MDKTKWLALREPNINSTDSAALFGLSKYKSEFTLYHEKKKNIDDLFVENIRSILGDKLESGIAAAFEEITGWDNRPFKDYLSIDDLRIGSSFDYEITSGPFKDWILEIKLVDFLIFRDEWIYNDDDNTGEAPAHIEVQVQHQLLVSGKKGAIILACVGGNSLNWIIRERDESMIEAIKNRIAKFWHDFDNNLEPSPNYNTDSKSIAALYKNADNDKFIDISENDETIFNAHLDNYKKWSDEISKLEALKQSVKSEIWHSIGDAGKALSRKYKLTATRTKDKTEKEKEIKEVDIGTTIKIIKEIEKNDVGKSYVVSVGKGSYRQFRVTKIKGAN